MAWTRSVPCSACSIAAPSSSRIAGSMPCSTRSPAATSSKGPGTRCEQTEGRPAWTGSLSPTSRGPGLQPSSESLPQHSGPGPTGRRRCGGSTSPSRASRERPGRSASRPCGIAWSWRRRGWSLNRCSRPTSCRSAMGFGPGARPTRPSRLSGSRPTPPATGCSTPTSAIALGPSITTPSCARWPGGSVIGGCSSCCGHGCGLGWWRMG